MIEVELLLVETGCFIDNLILQLIITYFEVQACNFFVILNIMTELGTH